MIRSAARPLPTDKTASTEETLIQVLYVDDETGLLKVAKPILEMRGSFNVETVSSVEEAMKKLEDKTFDVIVSDYIMPGKDGLQFLKELRNAGNNIPFILFTGKGREIVAIKALNWGADQYINKIGNPEAVYSELAHGIRTVVKGKKAEEELRESEEKFRNLAEKSPNMIFINKKGRVVYANKRCEEVMGYRKEEFYSPDFDFFRLIAPESIEKLKSSYSRHLEGKEVLPYEYTLVTKEGKKIEAILTSKLITYEGEPAILGIITDVTERKKVEAELKREKELMEMVTANNAAALAIISKDFRILWANKLLTDHLGDIRGKVCYSTLNTLNDVCPGCGVKEILETGKNKVVHNQVVPGIDGQKLWLEITAIPIRDKNGNLIAISELAIDVTNRKKAEEALMESERRFRELSELLPEVIFETDAAGLITFVNQAAFERFGYSREDFDKGLNVLQMLVPEDQKRAEKNVGRVLQGEKIGPHEYTAIKKDGTTFPFIINSAPIIHGNKPVGMRGVIVDITEHKKTEEQLRDSEKRFRAIIDSAKNPIILLCETGEIIYWNTAAEKTFGYTEKEAIGKELHSFLVPERFYEDYRRGLKKFKKTGQGAAVGNTLESKAIKKDGTEIPIELSLSSLKLKGKWCAIGIVRDVTERKKAEEKVDRIMNDLMAINEKLGVVGRLTRHDARNKLSVIANNVYLAKQKLAADHGALEFLGDVESAVEQMEKIFDFSRTYEMLGVEELTPMDVGKSVEEAAILLSGMNDIELVNECRGLTVMADSLLRQLFYNLIDDTMKHGEKVSRIRVYPEEDENQLKLVYEDDGVGVPEKEKGLIFKEGYGKGTGYGLYLIKKICEAYGWTIRETGKQGKGARFTMTIPKTNKNGRVTESISSGTS